VTFLPLPLARHSHVFSPFIVGGIWGAYMWAGYLKSLHKSVFPKELSGHINAVYTNLKEPGRMNAVYHSLFASKREATLCISTIKCPVLCIMGTADPDFTNPEDEVKWIEIHFPTPVTRLLVDKAGHYPHYEYPTECGNGIKAWMTKYKLR